MDNSVFLLRVDSYNPAALTKAVGMVFEALAIQDALAGQNVLLKPNLLVAAAPERAVCTHPEVIRAILRHLRASHLFVGDSPGLGSTEKVAKATGVYDVCRDEGAKLMDFCDPQPVATPEAAHSVSVPLASALLQVDAVVNCAKLKTHALTRYTGAVKNLFGCLPGKLKAQMHLRMEDTATFANYLLDIYLTVNPVVNFVDGIVAMEGNGPRNGTPRNVGVLLAGTDAIAVDTVACAVVGIDPFTVPTINAAAKRGIGCSELEKISILGAALDDVKISDFKTIGGSASTLKNLPPFLQRLLRKQLTARPHVNISTCSSCGICFEACPVGAVAIDGGAVIDHSGCIKCYCCQELCPDGVISLKRRGLGRLIK